MDVRIACSETKYPFLLCLPPSFILIQHSPSSTAILRSPNCGFLIGLPPPPPLLPPFPAFNQRAMHNKVLYVSCRLNYSSALQNGTATAL